MELWQRLHDDADERQVEHGDSSFDLKIGVSRVRVMAGQEVVNNAHHFLMQTKHSTVKQTKSSTVVFLISNLNRIYLHVFTNIFSLTY